MLSKKRKADTAVGGTEEQEKKPSSDESFVTVSMAGSSHAVTQVTSMDFDASETDTSFFANLSQSLSSTFDSAEENSSDTELPDNVNVLKFLECRASEIATLMTQVQSTKHSQAIQQLPRHMRRRASSHKANRVPRRLRQKVAKEVQKAKKGKRPSRKHRRRPSHLLSEYNRRQREHVWQETHIWFAKRFKMQSLWGYKIPLHPNDKSVRSAYKASSRYVLLQDMSYLCCIELKAPQDALLERLTHLTKTCVGLTFGAKIFLSGAREGRTVLYHPDSHPYKRIAPVSFLWKPLLVAPNDSPVSDEAVKAVSNAQRQLWIWCHPMCYQEIVDILQDLFQLQKLPARECENVPDSQDLPAGQIDSCDTCKTYTNAISNGVCDNQSEEPSIKKIKKEKFSVSDLTEMKAGKSKNHNILDEKVKFRFHPSQIYSSGDVTMTLLKDNLVRHRLIGPLSQAVLADTLKLADVSSAGCGELRNVTNSVKWWEEFYRKSSHRSLHVKQKELWEKMLLVQSPTQLPPGMVFGMTVQDPRLDLPKVKTKVTSLPESRWNSVPSVFSQQLPHSVSLSPLWDECIRNEVSSGKVPENELNKMRSQFLVPGSRLELGREESRIPVIVVQQPGYEGYCSGWDIIAPLGWSMAFWIAFIYRGARASGLRETKSMAREAGLPLFPYDYPDTVSGIQTEESTRVEMMTKHFRYPPAKRPSFGKLGILAPFFRPWETLVTEWEHQINTDGSSVSSNLDKASDSKYTSEMGVPITKQESGRNFFVLQEKKKLSVLKEACVFQTIMCQQKNHQKNKQYTAAWNALEGMISFIRSYDSVLRRSLLCIELKCLNKGKPCDYSGIYLPTSLDLNTLKRNLKYGGPVERIHPVKKIPKDAKQKSPTHTKSAKLDTEQESKEGSLSAELCRPEVENLISHCDRKLVGFVGVGEYSFLNGCGCGIGHCSLIGFLEVLRTCNAAGVPPTVLVRSQSSFQYRFATICVVMKNC